MRFATGCPPAAGRITLTSWKNSPTFLKAEYRISFPSGENWAPSEESSAIRMGSPPSAGMDQNYAGTAHRLHDPSAFPALSSTSPTPIESKFNQWCAACASPARGRAAKPGPMDE